MISLYVDIDDTLVKWKDIIEGRLAQDWEVNHDVLKLINLWHENSIGPITIWSSGGYNYAMVWANRLIPSHIQYAVASKSPLIASPTSVYIDDMPWETFKPNTIHPNELRCL